MSFLIAGDDIMLVVGAAKEGYCPESDKTDITSY